jgi:hypothetical protein
MNWTEEQHQYAKDNFKYMPFPANKIVEEMLAEIERLQNPWLPIEQHDRNENECLLAAKITPSEEAARHGANPFWTFGLGRPWNDAKDRWTGILGGNPTHWMPLPQPPKGE